MTAAGEHVKRLSLDSVKSAMPEIDMRSASVRVIVWIVKSMKDIHSHNALTVRVLQKDI